MTLNKTMNVLKRGTIVYVEFPERQIYIMAERIRETSSLVKAEVSISVGPEDHRVLLNRGRVSLLEDTPKTRLIDLLIEKGAAIAYSDPNDEGFWGNIVDDSFYAIVDKFREGNEAKEMTNLEEATPRTYAISPIITKGVANLLWGPGGSFKSYFGLLACIMIDKGLTVHGMSARKGKALFLDWEEDESVMKGRLVALQTGLGLPNPYQSGIIRKEMAAEKLAHSTEELSKLIHQHQIDFVCVDSVNPALAGNSVDSDAIEEYFAALRQLQVTSLSIDHANRAGERSGKFEIHGSAFKYNRSRQVYEAKKIQIPNSDSSEFALYHRKSNDSALGPPKVFEVTFDMRKELNPEEDRFDNVLHKITFAPKKLREASGEFMRAMEIPEIAYELMRDMEECEISTLAADISEIKNSNITPAILTSELNGSSGLVIDGDWVTLASQRKEESLSVREQLEELGAQVVSVETLNPCSRCESNNLKDSDRGRYCLTCGAIQE